MAGIFPPCECTEGMQKLKSNGIPDRHLKAWPLRWRPFLYARRFDSYDCSAYPCARYDEFDAADSFVPHSRRAADLDRAREVGLDAYIDELRAKRAILDKLLANYNDGRRKTFYCAAVYLLPLEDLKNVVAKLEDQPECPVKERAAAAAKLLQETADGHGVCLRLIKKKG